MPPARVKGSGLYLGIGLTESATKTELSGIARGLDAFDLQKVEDQRDTPGSGEVMGKQSIGYVDGTASFNVDENSITRHLFFGKNAQRVYVEYGPQGQVATKPKFTFEAIQTVTWNWEERSVRRYTVQLQVDGDITEGVYT